MTREEFLRELRIALQGRIPQGQVNEQLQYYENYIIEESRKGRTQQEVLESLGNPRLIAKTIADTFGGGIYYERQTEKETQGKRKSRGIHTWPGRLVSFIFVLIFLVFLIKIGLVLLPALAGAFMLGAILYLLYKIFFGNKK